MWINKPGTRSYTQRGMEKVIAEKYVHGYQVDLVDDHVEITWDKFQDKPDVFLWEDHCMDERYASMGL